MQPADGANTFTIHLVCTSRLRDLPKRANTTTPSRTSQIPTAPLPPEQNHNAPGESTNLPNPLFQTQPNFVHPAFQWPTTTANTTGTPAMLNQQQLQQAMLYQQQMYLAQLTQMYFNQMGTSNGALPAQIPAATFPQVQPNLVPQVVPPQQAPQAQAPQIQRMNAGPGGAIVDDDDENNNRNRDWLDWFYWMSRAVVLFSIVYFYSSFSRFLVVVGLAVMLYFYQTGWLRQRANRNENRNAVNNNNNNPVHNNNNRNVNNENLDDNHEDITEAQDIQEDAEEQEAVPQNDSTPRDTEQLSGLRLIWTVVSSLFTSLIPEQPPAPVNFN